MRSWEIGTLAVEPRKPEVISSSDETRAIVLHLPAGERLRDHEVHERAWLVVVSGEVEILGADGAEARGGPGLVAEFAPKERHELRASSDARLLLLLTPWPGYGHPGALTLEHKAEARERARR